MFRSDARNTTILPPRSFVFPNSRRCSHRNDELGASNAPPPSSSRPGPCSRAVATYVPYRGNTVMEQLGGAVDSAATSAVASIASSFDSAQDDTASLGAALVV